MRDPRGPREHPERRPWHVFSILGWFLCAVLLILALSSVLETFLEANGGK
jgi:hypothetical protein